MKKRMFTGLAASAVAASLAISLAAPAFAGEVNGKGDPTPIDAYRAGSICSFSGLNDDPLDPAPFEGGRVQSFGDIVQEVVKTTGRGAAPFTSVIREEGPGTSCRGYASQG